MKICPNKIVYFNIAFVFLSFCVLDAYFLIDSKGDALPFVIIWTILMLAILLPNAVATGKVMILDSEGCTISFLWYRKYYLWSEFSVKKMEDWHNVISYRQRPEEGAMFSIKSLHRPRWLGPLEFCAIRAPFSSFFVCFCIGDKRSPNIYTVDKESFLSTLAQWGVELDE